MTQDFKLGLRVLLKYPGLTVAGGLALALAIGVGAGWHELSGTLFSPTIPLPDGDRLVWVQTRNTLTNQPESRVAREFLDWQRELRTVNELGAYRTGVSNLIVGSATPRVIRSAEITPVALRASRVAPLFGRSLEDTDAEPGASDVVVLSYDLWRRDMSGRSDVVGATVKLGGRTTTVIGIMPDGFGYPVNQQAWTPLRLANVYGPLDGGPLNVIGRLATGITVAQADAELRLFGERAASSLPQTHAHLRSRVLPLGVYDDVNGAPQLALRNFPALLVLLVACMNVGTLIYARTATREGEIAVRSALGASRTRIVGQLFVEALLLTLVSATVGLLAADRTIRFGRAMAESRAADVPFWFAPGISLPTIVYACGLAVTGAALLSLLPALRATRPNLQANLANLGTGRATLRFGRVWTGVMIGQVALTAMAIPVALESTAEIVRTVSIRSQFPSADFVAARFDASPSADEALDAQAFERTQARWYADLERRLLQSPETAAVTFADYAPGTTASGQNVEIAPTTTVAPIFESTFTAAVGPRFFETIGRPIVDGRDFHAGDRASSARAVVVNEAFARRFQRQTGEGSPVGARLRRRPASEGPASAQEPWYDIVGVAKDTGLDPIDGRDEASYVYYAASPATVAPLVILARLRDNAGRMAARVPLIAAAVDPRLTVQYAVALDELVRTRDRGLLVTAGALGGLTLLVLAMSAMGIFSLMSVSVSRRTREIGLRTALGAEPRQIIVSVVSRAAVVVASGGVAGGALLLWMVSFLGPSGNAAEDIALFVQWLAVASLVMLGAGVLASLGPARRALHINPSDALRDG